MATEMATTQDFVNWVCGESISPEYLLYVFRSMTHEFRRLTMGSTHQTIYMPDVGKFSTPVPPILEQDRIVAFIRKETARIDGLVAKKERLIELLQEKRAALITRAVTKGLDPTVPMKDSGVEWLGEIPAHWEVKRLKHVAAGSDRGSHMKPSHDVSPWQYHVSGIERDLKDSRRSKQRLQDMTANRISSTTSTISEKATWCRRGRTSQEFGCRAASIRWGELQRLS